MRKSTMFGLALAAMLILGGLATASASAVEAEFAPFPNVIKEVKSGPGELTGGPLPIACKKDKGGETGGKGGLVKTAKTGHFDVLFEECTTAGGLIKCKSLDSTTAGSILTRGTFEAVYVLKEGTNADEDPALVFEIEPVHIECATELAKVTGSVCGLITPVNVKTKTFTVTIEGNKAKETYSKVKGATTGLLKCQLFQEKDGTGEKVQAFEKTTEEVVVELEGELKA